MGASIYGKTTYFDTTAIKKVITDCGIPYNKISTMVLNKDASYLSNAISAGKMNTDCLKSLCAFLSLEYDDIVVVIEPEKPKKQEVTEVPTTNIPQLDVLIVGLNQLYETQKLEAECLKNILEQTKITNTKINRLENALGQIVNHAIAIKDQQTNIHNNIRDIKSSTATISGRTKDIYNKVEKL